MSYGRRRLHTFKFPGTMSFPEGEEETGTQFGLGKGGERLGSQRGNREKESSGSEKAHAKTQLRLKLQKL